MVVEYDPTRDLKEQLGSALHEIKRLHEGLEKVIDEGSLGPGVGYAELSKEDILEQLRKLYPRRERSRVCGHCGRTDVGTHPGGLSSIGDIPLCHPNVPGRPDCYRLVTVYRHKMGCVECSGVTEWTSSGLPAYWWSNKDLSSPPL